MSDLCERCRLRPATIQDGTHRLCAACAARAQVTRSTLPYLGAALTAAALVAGGALLVDKMQQNEGEKGKSGTNPIGDLARRLGGGTPTLAAFSRDLTELARTGKLDPVIGRDDEVERLVSILARRSKNNPVLVGEPGVGKTAIVEGLAQRIIAGNVPSVLRDKRVLALSLGPLVAGTKYRGEFESRVKKILDEVRRAARDIVLFIDELHTLVGAGAAEGSLDLSSMIKPELARGELQCVGATTFDEYRKYVESDAALERRFQPVQVDEPTVEQTVEILRGLRPKYAAHHAVTIDDEALTAAAALAARYIADRYLPDKAIDVVDEAAATAAMRGEKRVDVERVAAVVSRWTGIPQGAITDAQRAGLLALEQQLEARVVGQNDAVRAVAEAIRRARAGLKDPRKPVGGFLFIGPSGVGKTELARALAGFLFDDERSLIRIDMSEYQEKHTVARLIGAPPGYVGYEEGGQLTEAVRRRPFSVVLFDEIEKAAPDVFNVFLQVLDDGRLTDGQGRTVDFRNVIIIMTSNVGSQRILAYRGDSDADYTLMRATVLDELRQHFRPEFLNRVDDIVVFKALSEQQLEQIVEIQLARVRERLTDRHITLELTPAARRHLVHAGYDPVYGARPLKRAIQRELETPLARKILAGELHDGEVVIADYDEGAGVLTLNVQPTLTTTAGATA